jgi:twitching motility protein PilT
MVEHMNEHTDRHVVTVEDPVEFVFRDKRCAITQREIGIDTPDFASALKHVVRQTPDVILVGEMRDTETIEAALQAAESGHLVLSTLHTVNAVQTVERIISFFPPHQHPTIRLQMALVLEGVVSQRLVTRRASAGRVPAVEVLLGTPTVKELLLEGRTRELPRLLEESHAHYGTQTFNQSLRGLVGDGLIEMDDALAAADNPDELMLAMRGIGKGLRTTTALA